MTTAERSADTLASLPDDFCYIDTAIGGADRRNYVQRLDAFTPSPQATDCYRSWLQFTPELLTHATANPNKNGRPSVAGYAGPAWTGRLIFDFDAGGDLRRAQRDLRTFVGALLERDVPLEAIGICFSGSKGFSVELPATLFGNFAPAPCRDLAARLGHLAALLAAGLGLSTMDVSIYEPLRLWRVPNTRHGTSGLYKIPISFDEAMRAPDELRALAQKPRTIERPPEDEWLPRSELVALWEQAAETNARRRDTSPAQGPIPERIPESQRHNTLRRVAVRLAKQAHSAGQIRALLLVMNDEQCAPPLPEDEVRALAAWAADLPADAEGEEDEWCPRCARRGEQLEARIAKLEDWQLRTASENADLKHRLATFQAAMVNGAAGQLRGVAACLWDYDKRPGRRRGRDGMTDILLRGRRRDVAEDDPQYGAACPSSFTAAYNLSADAASDGLHALAALGMLRLEGVTKTGADGSRRTAIRYQFLVDEAECYRKIATLPQAERVAAAKAGRRRCPNCGSAATVTVTYCAHCGEVLNRRECPGADEGTQGQLGVEPVDIERTIAAQSARLRKPESTFPAGGSTAPESKVLSGHDSAPESTFPAGRDDAPGAGAPPHRQEKSGPSIRSLVTENPAGGATDDRQDNYLPAYEESPPADRQVIYPPAADVLADFAARPPDEWDLWQPPPDSEAVRAAQPAPRGHELPVPRSPRVFRTRIWQDTPCPDCGQHMASRPQKSDEPLRYECCGRDVAAKPAPTPHRAGPAVTP